MKQYKSLLKGCNKYITSLQYQELNELIAKVSDSNTGFVLTAITAPNNLTDTIITHKSISGKLTLKTNTNPQKYNKRIDPITTPLYIKFISTPKEDEDYNLLYELVKSLRV